MILFGAGGHVKSVMDIAHSIEERITLIYDDNPLVESIFDIPVQKYIIGGIIPIETWVITIGCNRVRKVVRERLFGKFGVLVHKTASISHWAKIGNGTVVMAQAVINAGAFVGNHCIINSGAIVEHDCILEDFVHLSPNVGLGGAVTIKEGSHIGTGACIIPGITIGKWATVGAGAVIIKDVPDGAVVVGNPGRIIVKKPTFLPRPVTAHPSVIRRVHTLNDANSIIPMNSSANKVHNSDLNN